jgi:hypothetical protein
MSRSYHITKNEAAKRFVQGDPAAVVQYAEKRDVKKTHKKYRKVYRVIHASSKTPRLRNSVARSAVKRVLKQKQKTFLEKSDA